MRIGCRVAMPGKVLRGRQNARPRHRVRARNECGNECRHIVRVLSVGADIDDRIVGIVVDVGIGKKEPLHTQRARFPRRDFAFDMRLFRIARGCECHCVRKDRRRIHSHGSAALEIGGDKQRNLRQPLHAIDKTGGFQRIGLGDCAAVGNVDQNQAAHVLLRNQVNELAVLARASVHGMAAEPDDDELRNPLSRGHRLHPPLCNSLIGRGTIGLWAAVAGFAPFLALPAAAGKTADANVRANASVPVDAARARTVQPARFFCACCQDRAATPGFRRCGWAASFRIARSNSGTSLLLLLTSSSAPDDSVVNPKHSMKPDSRMIRAGASVARIRRISSTPSIPPMRRSVTTTSKRRSEKSPTLPRRSAPFPHHIHDPPESSSGLSAPVRVIVDKQNSGGGNIVFFHAGDRVKVTELSCHCQ